MSYIGIIVSSVFASNALLTYGLGSIPVNGAERSRDGREGLAMILTLVLVNALAASVLWCIHAFVLSPLGLGSLDIFFFALLAVPILKFLSKAAVLSGKGLLLPIGEKADELIVGSLVFGIALLSAESGYTLLQALAGSAASGLGYWLATGLLQSIRERLELSDLPRRMRGAPAMLLSAGLMALALMGIDAGFVKALAG